MGPDTECAALLMASPDAATNGRFISAWSTELTDGFFDYGAPPGSSFASGEPTPQQESPGTSYVPGDSLAPFNFDVVVGASICDLRPRTSPPTLPSAAFASIPRSFVISWPLLS